MNQEEESVTGGVQDDYCIAGIDPETPGRCAYGRSRCRRDHMIYLGCL